MIKKIYIAYILKQFQQHSSNNPFIYLLRMRKWLFKMYLLRIYFHVNVRLYSLAAKWHGQ